MNCTHKKRRHEILVMAIISLLVCSLSACGFHLKGRSPLPPELASVYIDYQVPYEVIEPTLQAELRAQLQQRGAQVTTDPAAAPGRLTIAKLQQSQRTQSVGPTGKAIEYQLITTAQFEYRVGGTIRVPLQTLTVQRDYSFDETQLLAKEAQREKLQNEMQRDLAGLIMLRLDAEFSGAYSSTAPAAGAQ